MGCCSMEVLDLPAGLTALPDNALEDGWQLKDIHFGGTKAQWNAMPKGSGNDILAQVTIHCTDGDLAGQKPGETQKPESGLPQNVHDWARTEVETALALGLVPIDQLGSDYTLPITRGSFSTLAVQLYETSTGRTAPMWTPPSPTAPTGTWPSCTAWA